MFLSWGRKDLSPPFLPNDQSDAADHTEIQPDMAIGQGDQPDAVANKDGSAFSGPVAQLVTQ